MHILVVGPGAMGCLLAAYLHRSGTPVTLADYNPERAAWLNAHGITITGIIGHFTARVPVVVAPPPLPVDVVLVCVKAYSTRKAAERIRDWLDPGTTVVTLQNGVGNREILEDCFRSSRVIAGVTSEGATLLGPGRTNHAGQGETVLGMAGEPNDKVAVIVEPLTRAGFKVRTVENIQEHIWGKLVINAGINALSAITRLRNGRLPQLPETRELMERAVSEAAAVAKAKGIDLPYPDPLARVIEVCQATATNRSSMLQDVLNRRRTEVAQINGAVVREATTLGLAAPVNGILCALVEAIQSTYREAAE